MRALADGTVVLESADAIPFDPARLDVRAASSRGFGELIARAGPCERLLRLPRRHGDDGRAAPACSRCWTSCPRRRPCSATRGRRCAEAPRLFGPQKGALADEVAELERRFADHAQSFAKLPGAGAAGGLGAALASLGAQLVPGAAYVLEAVGFRERAAASRPRRHRRGHRRPHDLRRQGARARRSAPAPSSACAACSSAAESRTASRRPRSAATRRVRGRTWSG